MEEIEFDSAKIHSYFKEKDSDKEADYVEKVFCDDTKEKELKNLLSGQFNSLLAEDITDNKDVDHILHKIHYEINTKQADEKRKSFSRILRWSLRIAGMVIVPLAVFWGIRGYLINNTGKETFVEIHAPAWTRARFTLPDGTAGWLNSNSSVRYSGNFVVDRQVTLQGEAYFDVSKDKLRPFRVTTNDITLKVLGTRFNVASYDNETSVEVVLEEGKLELSDREKKTLHTLVPNEMVVFNKEEKQFSIEVVEPKKYLAWTEGKLVFRNDPVDVVARRLERWYNIEVEVRGCLSEDLRLRATFVDEDIEEVLDILKRSLSIDYQIENRDIKPDDTYAKKKVILSYKANQK
jgi:transmembrane sensor